MEQMDCGWHVGDAQKVPFLLQGQTEDSSISSSSMSDFLKTWSAVTPEALKSQTLGLCGHVVAQAGLAGSSRQGWPGIFPSRTLSCSQIQAWGKQLGAEGLTSRRQEATARTQRPAGVTFASVCELVSEGPVSGFPGQSGTACPAASCMSNSRWP